MKPITAKKVFTKHIIASIVIYHHTTTISQVQIGKNIVGNDVLFDKGFKINIIMGNLKTKNWLLKLQNMMAYCTIIKPVNVIKDLKSLFMEYHIM